MRAYFYAQMGCDTRPSANQAAPAEAALRFSCGGLLGAPKLATCRASAAHFRSLPLAVSSLRLLRILVNLLSLLLLSLLLKRI